MAEIKKWNGSAWEVTYPKTTAGNIVASGTPSSTTFLRGDGTWATPAGGSATDLSVGTVTSTNVPILSSSGADITTLPAATGSLAGILTAGTQTIGGAKTFSNTIAAPSFEFSNTNGYLWDDGGDLTWTQNGTTDYAVFTAGNKPGLTGINWGTGTDGYVLTSDGAGGAAWEAASGGGGGATILYDDYTTTLNITSTSYSTPANTPELSLSANKKYYVRCMGIYSASTVGTGLGLSAYFSSSTGVTILGGKLMVMDTATISGVTSEDTAPWYGASVVPGSSANSMLATTGPGTQSTYFGFDGFVSVGGTATTLKIAFRTEVSATTQYIEEVALYAVEVA